MKTDEEMQQAMQRMAEAARSWEVAVREWALASDHLQQALAEFSALLAIAKAQDR